MNFPTLRPAELAAATLVSIAILVFSVAPALVLSPPAHAGHGAVPAGIEWKPSPEALYI